MGTPQLLGGETLVYQVPDKLSFFFHQLHKRGQTLYDSTEGCCWVTNYRLILFETSSSGTHKSHQLGFEEGSSQQQVSIALCCIEKLQVQSLLLHERAVKAFSSSSSSSSSNLSENILELQCKDFNRATLSFAKVETLNETEKALRGAMPAYNDDLFCFKTLEVKWKNLPEHADGWNIYDPVAEFQRIKVPLKEWRISDLNRDYSFSLTHASHLAVPKKFNDAELKDSRVVFSLSWRNARNNAMLFSLRPIGRALSSSVDVEKTQQKLNKKQQKEQKKEKKEKKKDTNKKKGSATTSSTLQPSSSSSPSPSSSSPSVVFLESLLNALGENAKLRVYTLPSSSSTSTSPASSLHHLPQVNRHTEVLSLKVATDGDICSSLQRLKTLCAEGTRETNAVVEGGQKKKKEKKEKKKTLPFDSVEKETEVTSWMEELEQTNWLKHIRVMLRSVGQLLKRLEKGESILIANRAALLFAIGEGNTSVQDKGEEEDGGGEQLVPLLNSLVQLCADPYYRTISGFGLLVEKEWISSGFKFGQKLATATNDKTKKNEKSKKEKNKKEKKEKKEKKSKKTTGSKGGKEASTASQNGAPTSANGERKEQNKTDPLASVFIMFLDCVFQLWEQYPSCFEFNEEFLLFLVDSLYNCRFGSFLVDSPKERMALKERTISIWSLATAKENSSRFTNPFYAPSSSSSSSSLSSSSSHSSVPSRRPTMLPERNGSADKDPPDGWIYPIPEHVRLWNAYYLRWVCRSGLLTALSNIEQKESNLYFAPEGGQSSGSNDLRGIGLHIVPKEIAALMKRLRTVDLSGNFLNSFSPHLAQLSALKKLSLANNQIATIDSTMITGLKHLVELDLSYNSLSSLPNGIGSALTTSIRALHLDGNELQNLPASLSCLTNLHYLTLGDNRLQGAIPSWLIYFPKLSKLVLDSNDFEVFPEGILPQLTRLKVLDIGNNPKLKSVPGKELIYLKDLNTFSIANNTHLQGHLLEFHWCTKPNPEGDTNNNNDDEDNDIDKGLERTGEKQSECRLKSINLEGIHLDFFFEGRKEFKRYMEAQRLANIVLPVTMMTEVEQSDDTTRSSSSKNKRKLGPALFKASSSLLKHSLVSGDNKRVAQYSVPSQADDIFSQELETIMTLRQKQKRAAEDREREQQQEQELDRHEQDEEEGEEDEHKAWRLKPVRRFWKGLANIQILNLSSANLTCIPFEVLALDRLQKLLLNFNSIAEIPKEISNLCNLIELQLEGNKLTEIPIEIGHLRRLRIFNVIDNEELTRLPSQLGCLRELEQPVASGSFSNVLLGTRTKSSKRALTLSTKGATSTDSLRNSTARFTTSNNSGSNGHPDKSHYRRFGLQLNYDSPQWQYPTRDIMSRGQHDVMSFLRQAFNGNTKLHSMKLMLVGQENVGKTSVLRCLDRHYRGNATPGTPPLSTDGIDIEHWKINIKFKGESKDVELSVWDFAGQELYYTTHQFFLSARSMFLVVWNVLNSESEECLEHWLYSVTSRASSAPILLVGTHIDDESIDQNWIDRKGQDLKERFARFRRVIKGIYFISCSAGQGLPELVNKIDELLSTSSHMGEEVPNSYIQLQTTILQERKSRHPPIISWDEHKALGRLCGIDNESDLLTATCFLHNFGSLIYFEKDEKLNNLVILSPQWLTKMMSTIITTKHKWAKEGLLYFSALPQIWQEPDYPPHLHPFLLSLLNLFEISFDIMAATSTASVNNIPQQQKTNERYLLIPSLLPIVRPTTQQSLFDEFERGNTNQDGYFFFGRRYQFEYLPSGFFSRVMARLIAEPDFHIMTFWKFSMLISCGKEIALLETSPEKKEFSITIKKPLSSSMRDFHQDKVGLSPYEEEGEEGHTNDQFTCMVLIASCVDAFLEDWYQVNPKVGVLCSHCYQKKEAKEPFYYELGACENAAQHLRLYMYCGHHEEWKEPKAKEKDEEKEQRLAHREKALLEASKACPAVPVSLLVPDLAMLHLRSNRLRHDQLKYTKQIGEGSFAFVYKGTLLRRKQAQQSKEEKQITEKVKEDKKRTQRNRSGTVEGQDGVLVAIKKLKTDLKSSAAFDEFRREIWLMSKLRHPNLVNLEGFTLSPCCIVVEFLGGGDLWSFLHNEKNKPLFEDAERWHPMMFKLAKDIAKGCRYLHSALPPVVHRDLKSPNVLLVEGLQSEHATVLAKVADFGASQQMIGELRGRKVDNPVWLAPEIIKTNTYTEKADVYSFGVILWEMLTQQDFFGQERFFSQLEDKIVRGLRPAIPRNKATAEGGLPEYCKLISECWQNNAERRPSFESIVQRIEDTMKEHYPLHANYDVGGPLNIS